MSSAQRGLSARSLAELALIVSRVARTNIDDTTLPTIDSLRSLWQGTRSLEQRWTKVLHGQAVVGKSDTELLMEITPRVVTTEMLVRVWSTAIASFDKQHGRDDLVRIARNAVNSLVRVRNGLLSRLVAIPDGESIRVAEVDRLRRRCERWTDILVGCMAVRSSCYEFAYNPIRSRDFSEESLTMNPATGPNVAEHFVSAGLQLNFLRHLTVEPIDEPEIVDLVQSILSVIPADTFHRDGTLRSLLEQRIAASRRRLERRASITVAQFTCGDEVSL